MMELYQANQLSDQSQRKKECSLCTELELGDGALREDRLKSCQEIEKLRRICCAEAERANQSSD